MREYQATILNNATDVLLGLPDDNETVELSLELQFKDQSIFVDVGAPAMILSVDRATGVVRFRIALANAEGPLGGRAERTQKLRELGKEPP